MADQAEPTVATVDDGAQVTTTPSAGPNRWHAWKQAARQLPPPAHEVAVALLLGALMVGLTNALAIALAVPLPPEGWPLRLRHHAVELLLTLGVGAWLALPAACCAWLVRRYRWLHARWVVNLAWLGYAAAGLVGMYGLLGIQLRRQSYVPFEGVASAALFPLYVLLCGMALPAAHIVGGYFARVGWPRYFGAAAAFVAVTIDHALLRDDYPGLHAAVLWVSLCMFGAVFADRAWVWLRRRGQLRGLALAAGGLGLTVALVHPSNTLRMQLFREPGAAASWALARTLWRPPTVTAKATPLANAPLDHHQRAMALLGITRDPIVIIVSIDALRADVLERPDAEQRFPYMWRMRSRGTVFTQAVAAGSQTSVSLSSMFSSRYFSQMHWQLHGRGGSRFTYPAADTSPRFPSLLDKAGVGTHGFIGLIFLSQPFGTTGGFAHEQVVVSGRGHASVASVLSPLLKELRKPNTGPQLYYTHVMEPHEPYNRGKLKKGAPYERYLSEVTLVDQWIGKIVRVIQQRHRRRAYLIVTADHGEAFGEHGTTFHTKTLYDELLRVPLSIWGAGVPRGRVDVRVSLIDVGPTVLHFFRQQPQPGFMGRSLLPLIHELRRRTPWKEAAAAKLDLPRTVAAEGRLRRALYVGDLKVIEDTLRKTVEVYDLKADPGETHNLFEVEPARSHPAVAAERAFFEQHRLKRDGYQPPFKP